MNILIVDDSELMRTRIKAMLSEITEVENISQAKDAQEAMRFFEKYSPDVVTLDLRMPGGNGLRLLQRIKDSRIKDSSQKMVVIVLTNYPYPQYRRKCMANGADFFFDKSTEFDKVIEVVKRLVHDSQKLVNS